MLAPSNPNDLPTASRTTQATLALIVLCLCGILAHRTYSPKFTSRPIVETTRVSPTAMLELNDATRPELLQLPGVGPRLADAILSHRAEQGQFDSLDDLNHVPGVGGKTLDKLRPFLQVSEPVETLAKKPRVDAAPLVSRSAKMQLSDPKLNINEATDAEFLRLPKVGPVIAAAIVAARAEKKFATVDDLRRVPGIGAKTLEILRPFVSVD
jgi:competence protein ComEA